MTSQCSPFSEPTLFEGRNMNKSIDEETENGV